MKKYFLLMMSFYFGEIAQAQNLVPNGDFELYGNVPCGLSAGPVEFDSALVDWDSPTQASPDVFSTLIGNNCANYQPTNMIFGPQTPRSGNICIGFYNYLTSMEYREYAQVKLTSPLIPGLPYAVKIHVSLGNNLQFACNNMGIGFSTTHTNSAITGALAITPQVLFTNIISDTANWVVLADTLIPTQPYEYLIIGNLTDDASTTISNIHPNGSINGAYYYCDDVSVVPITAVVENTCFGDSTFFYLYPNPDVIANFWNFGDTASGPDNLSYIAGPAHIFSSPGSYSVMNVNYYINGSSDTFYTAVNIGLPPVISLGNDTLLCTGDSIQLNAGGGFTSYLWSDGSVDSVVYVSTSATIYVEVNNNGCKGSDTISVNFITCSLPVVSLYSTDTVWCDKKSIDFYDLSTNNPTSWQWFFQGAQPDTSTLQNPSGIYYPNYGSYDVKLIACNPAGCDSLILTSFINEYQLPTVPTLTYSNDTLFSSPAYAYQWYLVPSVIPGANDPYYVPTQFGTYFVVISDSNGCQVSSNNFVINGIEELFIPVLLTKFKTITVFDATGKIILEKQVNSNTNFNIIIDIIKTNASGMYYIHADGNGLKKVWKYFNPGVQNVH